MKFIFRWRRSEKKFQKARELDLKASKLNFSGPINNLAWNFHEGIGVVQNIHEAIKLYKQVIELSYPTTMNNLANCYENGEDFPKKYSKSNLFLSALCIDQYGEVASRWNSC
jgi:TPR repeat protein